MEKHNYDAFEEDIKTALTAKDPDPADVETRLCQIHEVIRSSPYDAKAKEQLPALQQERADYLAQFGDFQPWLFLEGMNFKIIDGAYGKQAVFKAGTTEVNFSKPHWLNSEIHLTIDQQGRKSYHILPIFKSIDEVYSVMDRLTLPVNQKAPYRAAYERKYISQLKSKPKK